MFFLRKSSPFLCFGTIFSLFALALFGIAGSFGGFTEDNLGILITAGISLCIGLLLISKGSSLLMKEEKEEEAERQAAMRKKREGLLLSFHQKCVDAQCTDVKTTHIKEKMCLIAQAQGLAYPNGIEQLWKESQAAVKEKEKAEKARKLEELRAQERKTYTAWGQFASLSGRDKRIHLLTQRIAVLNGAIQAAHSLGQLYINSTYLEKESNPYTWGGIAEGLGGSGLLTAIQTEQENAEIRARNKQRLDRAHAYSDRLAEALVPKK